MSDVIVSVCVITYNHCNYIRQCLDGILMQQTNFPFEIIVNDDCSTDGTAEIVKEYELKYPQLFKVTYQTENQYSKGVRGMFPRFCFPRTRGKYIALCEGDDYWTDPLKLQKQVDFLEKNKTYSMCGHNCVIYLESTSVFKNYEIGISGTYTLNDIVTRNVYCPTLSVLFRRSAIMDEVFSKYKMMVDMSLAYHLLKYGLGYCLSDKMAVYRVHKGGVWSGVSENKQLLFNLNARMSICEVERDDLSSIFLANYIKRIGRLWQLKHIGKITKSFFYVLSQLGVRRTCAIFSR